MKHIKIMISICLLAFSAGNLTYAAVFDFSPANLGVSGSNFYDTVGMTVDGIELEINPYTILNDGLGGITSTHQLFGPESGVFVSSLNRLGIKSSSSDLITMDGGADGSTTDLDEGLMFTFDQVVSLKYINFDSFSGSDDFNLTVDGVHLITDFKDNYGIPLVSEVIGENDEFNFHNIVGNEFLFWADSDTDSFYIDELRVAKVPEPMTLFIIGIGWFGLSFLQEKPAHKRASLASAENQGNGALAK